ncbi:MAG: phosphoribosylformylglycinamidine synthase subunit PurQ [Sphingomonas sp.]|nr:phosphoribosylformylglycinamidine synthase subunit PurQ [Sphingomonas sp.]
MKSAVIVFPGSNCDRDLAVAIREVTGHAPVMLWHGESELPDGIGLIAVPGGFSYGDYLRSGAMAARSRIMPSIIEAAGRGVPVLGICNGFQILTEAGLLPVAHHDGNFTADGETLDRLEGEGRVAFRYAESVNGSARDIAGILNDAGNVLGMMPHPERVIEAAHGKTDGRRLFEGLLETVA